MSAKHGFVEEPKYAAYSNWSMITTSAFESENIFTEVECQWSLRVIVMESKASRMPI